MIPDASPDYMQIDDGEISGVFGPDITARIFSDEFTEFRATALVQTIPEAPEIGMAMLDIYPHTLETGELAWIERYVVKGEHEFGRTIMMLLDGNSLQFAHLLPGQSKASPMLQCDALREVYTLIMRERRDINGWDDLTLNEGLGGRGIPEIWPKGCPVSVFDSVVTKEPDEAGKAWSERWGFSVDGSEGADEVQDIVVVDIDFSAGPDGSTLIMPRIVKDS